ncbi:hypothetical protein Msil_2809 [Methylocella silvestris BL2]|uniref:Rhamnogalacturonase A/B/Epimerase-like pectate lyase domain-containing protein n=1 Tax=Methylocella silvestris (strain DSM 15510 / CIP 108128 / LMG 27833 / NCIMB 13906 / BL2) TaxID=395965 RepID=B8ET85_METSB|nr:glycosyl hydrolase family 28-related protein [Methylocella silvestris]ACK51727.1 hypothetical protein Msil_2809 [Methylocella silvestris BL2]
MLRIGSIYTCFLPRAHALEPWPPRRGRRRLAIAAMLIGLSINPPGAALADSAAKPIIINKPFSAKPGDVFSLAGSGFGSAPRVYLKPSRLTATTELPVKTADDATVVVEVPKAAAFDVYEVWVANGAATSPHVLINTPQPHHFDNPDIATGAHFRIFGRNLSVGTLAPTATLVDIGTGAQIKAVVGVSASNAYMLDVTPTGVVAGHAYKVLVSNGYASALSEASVLGHATGMDRFAIGQPWAYDFVTADGPGYKAGVKGTNLADHHVFNVRTDVVLATLAKGDGKTNDGPAIQGAINAAARYGGVVYLPAGTYNIGSTSISLTSNVLLQGQSASATKIIYTATKPGFIIGAGASMTGFVDLTLQNQDKTSTTTNLGTWQQPVSKVIIQRVIWDLGTGFSINLRGDRIAILNSTFKQAINSWNGSGAGALLITNATNLTLKNNTIRWASNQNAFGDLVNAIFENNHFTRSASDTVIAGPDQLSWPWIVRPIRLGDVLSRTAAGGRQVSLNFGTNIVFQNNVFDTSDGVIQYNAGDGETILNEGGGGSPREDFGTVTTASAATIADDSKCSGACAWKTYPNSKVVIVSGAGAGQWRKIFAQNGNSFTVDPPFDVVPAAGDHFTISAPSYENAIIRNNTMVGNPIGVAMYHGVFLNVSVIGNQLTNNGGIYLLPSQANQRAGRNFFNVARNIEINGNVLKNLNGNYPSYVSIGFVMMTQNVFWGKSVLAAEARNNQITARSGTFPYTFGEGYNHLTFYQNPGGGAYVEEGNGAMWGTVWQGNSCANCAVNYNLSTGAMDTTIWNAKAANSPGFVSTILKDTTIANSTKQASTRTLVGKD